MLTGINGSKVLSTLVLIYLLRSCKSAFPAISHSQLIIKLEDAGYQTLQIISLEDEAPFLFPQYYAAYLLLAQRCHKTGGSFC